MHACARASLASAFARFVWPCVSTIPNPRYSQQSSIVQTSTSDMETMFLLMPIRKEVRDGIRGKPILQ